MIQEIASAVKIGIKQGAIDNEKIPTSVKFGKQEWPLGRYLSGKLREELGQAKEVPQDQIEELGWKMRFMLEENIKRKGWPKVGGLATIAVRISEQQTRSLEKKEEIYKSRRHI